MTEIIYIKRKGINLSDIAELPSPSEALKHSIKKEDLKIIDARLGIVKRKKQCK